MTKSGQAQQHGDFGEPRSPKSGWSEPHGPLEVYAYEICQTMLQYPRNLQSYSVLKTK